MSQPVIGTPWKKLNAPVSAETLEGVEKYWRCANYLSVGQIYLRSNPLMKKDWVDEKTGETRDFGRPDVKHRLVGHWGTTPGVNFLFGHVNRLIADHQQNAIFLMGPGHGGPAGTAQSLLDGTYREIRPDITDDEAGLQKFFRQFSYPGGIPSHFAPETPGSIHEGGELGYTLSHAYGAVMDNPSLLAVAVVGDGEAETAALATSWQSNKLVNPKTDGIVLPILHLNGYKIANPTILARISDEELTKFFEGISPASPMRSSPSSSRAWATSRTSSWPASTTNRTCRSTLASPPSSRRSSTRSATSRPRPRPASRPARSTR